jgi:hypothetical protein
MFLQLDNCSEFIEEIISKLMEIWFNAKIVHGCPRHTQSQGSVECANQDIESMLSTWLHDNRTNNWLLGFNFMQLANNTQHYSRIGDAPYTVMYGQQSRLGISTIPLRADVIASIEREKDMDKILNGVRIIHSPQHSQGNSPWGDAPCTTAAIATTNENEDDAFDDAPWTTAAVATTNENEVLNIHGL